jgi:NADH dehydrogenase [ubiquinone] 1 alpha subcomplex assembly factor 7
MLLVANEFFDALPIRQLVRTDRGWRERMVGHDGERFVALAGGVVLDALIPVALRAAPQGATVELAPAGESIAAAIADRLLRSGGAALIVDYG